MSRLVEVGGGSLRAVGHDKAWRACDSGRGKEDVAVATPDTRVHDPLAMAEIELYGELVIAASSSDSRLPQDQIDAILGVTNASGGPE
jgi:hypothetical protein